MVELDDLKSSDHIKILAAALQLTEGRSIVKLQKLTETEIRGKGKSVATMIVNTIANQFENSPNMGNILRSKGDITKVKSYDEMFSSLQYLKTLYINKRSGKRPTVILDLEELANYLQDNRRLFINAFKKENNKIVMYYYSALVAALFQGTSQVIVNNVAYLSNGMSGTQVDLLPSLTDSLIESYISNISQTIRTGKSDEFLSSSIKNESSDIVHEDLITLGLVAFSSFLIFLYFIRNVVFLVLNIRDSTAEWLRSYSNLLKVRNMSVERSSKKEQLALAATFDKVASKIALDYDNGERVASKEISVEDKKISSNDNATLSNNSNSEILI